MMQKLETRDISLNTVVTEIEKVRVSYIASSRSNRTKSARKLNKGLNKNSDFLSFNR